MNEGAVLKGFQMSDKYRPNVAGILQNSEGLIFVAERIKHEGAWQFPQGGVDPGETVKQALFRELEEEIGVSRAHYEIAEKKDGYRYDFPIGHSKWKDYRGQEQTYYLLRFEGDDSEISIDTEHPEFSRWKWIEPRDFRIKWVPKFKREVYRQVMADFFELEL